MSSKSDNTFIYLALLAAAGIGLASSGKKKKEKKISETQIPDPLTRIIINKLHPAIRERVTRFILEARRRGINLIATSGLRSWAKQDDLYNQGRTKPGEIITNARGGESIHNFAFAIDVVPADAPADYRQYSRWKEIGEIGKSFGFEWGGDFTSLPKPDLVHFQYTFGLSLSQLKQLYNSGQRDGDYVRLPLAA